MTETDFQIFMANRPRKHTTRNGFRIGGVWVSVQGGYGKYSTPDIDGAYFYNWEVGYPSEEIKELLPYKRCKNIFAYVPTSVLLAIIDRLGEITERPPIHEVGPYMTNNLSLYVIYYINDDTSEGDRYYFMAQHEDHAVTMFYRHHSPDLLDGGCEVVVTCLSREAIDR